MRWYEEASLRVRAFRAIPDLDMIPMRHEGYP